MIQAIVGSCYSCGFYIIAAYVLGITAPHDVVFAICFGVPLSLVTLAAIRASQ
jgi:hypothetical protein